MKIWVCALALIVGSLITEQNAQGEEPIIESSTGIRHFAVFAPLPVFPLDLLSIRKQGLVVIQVTVGQSGKVASLVVLESFDAKASESVAQAVRSWRFEPLEKSLQPDIKAGRISLERARLMVQRGKLLFRFTIEDGRPVVTDLAADAQRRSGLSKRQ